MKWFVLAIALALGSGPAFAADDTIYRTQQQTVNALAYGAVSVKTTNDIPAGHRAVRLLCTTACYVAFGVTSSTATVATAATGVYMPAVTPEKFKVNPGEGIAVIMVSGAGTLVVTPLTQ